MPTDPRKRQKKQERRAAKRKSKHQELARAKHAGLPERLTAASRYPVLHSWVSQDLWKSGLGYVCLSRELPNGQVAFAMFLVDRFCLGVKDAMADIVGRFTYDSRIGREMRSKFEWDTVEPACARKLVEGAVEYARSLGLQPHGDYLRVEGIFGDIDPGQCAQEFEYGKDGKPLFMAGPNDTPERCRHILSTLEQSCGPDGFHYIIPASVGPKITPDALKDGGVRYIRQAENGGPARPVDES